MTEYTIKVVDTDNNPIAGVAISFAYTPGLPHGDVSLLPVGGQTDVTGTLVRNVQQYYNGALILDVTAYAPGFVGKTETLSAYVLNSIERTIVLEFAPLSVTVNESEGIPELVSVGQPGVFVIRDIPYSPVAYIETIFRGNNNDITKRKTPVSVDGTCSVSMSGCFRIDPKPTLVGNEENVLFDWSLTLDYTVTAYLISGRQRREVYEWNTTAILVSLPKISDYFFKWLPSQEISVQRGSYVDVMILLPKGSYSVKRFVGNTLLSALLVDTVGKAPVRIRVPSNITNASSVTMYVTESGIVKTKDLVIKFRQ